jgi:hypothetical protein
MRGGAHRELRQNRGRNNPVDGAFPQRKKEWRTPMRKELLVASALAFSLLAVPAMAQGYYQGYDQGYYRQYRDVPITGAQMTDFPSMRSNTTRTGSFLSPVPRAAYEDYGYRRAYRDGYRDRDYYGDRYYGDRWNGPYDDR